ncbi:hypothetical protein [Quadrisphaera sp. DSM 44207]|uniref:hypothetical protein n=1 Tax=Quadrisphaera sp. DSM 44207 TaxID=1881057 RepID=UPI000886A268|nr:hypothetical protein [Quadrisphaera sp. DSM 44207]SDQ85147.1 hypothetical protein SAMN05428996_2893 [Quadrisphaera sp. DSM 44207]
MLVADDRLAAGARTRRPRAPTSPSSTRRALLRLQHIGLVSSHDSSHARLYELQREHAL